MIRHATSNRLRGQGLIEAAVAFALLIPLFVVILQGTAEIVHAYIIKAALTSAANSAARNLALSYWKNPAIKEERALQDTMVFDGLRVDSIVADSRQFSDPVFDLESHPPVVSVTVFYAGGYYGLPPFPAVDPIGIADRCQISATATHSLE